MTKAKMVLSWCIPIVLNTVALMPPVVTEAKSIKIWPDQLKSIQPNAYDYYQSIAMVINGVFEAPLNLPLGARITRVTYYHQGVTSPASTGLYFYCLKMGNEREVLGDESSTDSTLNIIPVDVVLVGDPIIRAGYRYFIRVVSGNYSSYILGVKITYQE